MEHLEKFFRIMGWLSFSNIHYTFNEDYYKNELTIYLHEEISGKTWCITKLVQRTNIPATVSIKDNHFENDSMMRVITLTIKKGTE